MSDAATPGLFCKIGKQKSCFYLQKRIKGQKNPVTFFVGNLAYMGVDQARKNARALAAQCDQGRDPREENKNMVGFTVLDAWQKFYDIKKQVLRNSTLTVYRHLFNNHLSRWAKLDLEQVTANMMAQAVLESSDMTSLRSAMRLFNGIWELNRNVHLRYGVPMLPQSP
ncbi:integrase arm-type DNA-binding domain-containing protein [Sulfidibacter corallicola]|uniref:Integrase arm-type DNA-binding domain-containing protein n=1 Tax=Sulfidibacter corallicola TaxID=2818388 RepID=A0A8A4TML0_SULCO|nr:integrase arm-type DNA-binding domain-containing protein [Sulfidibacter corallicola]QTD50697.1 integrase arm-type DNA-binding domain-containing protein [Sulfidibacter corallicola]